MKRFKYNKQEVIELVWKRSVNRLVDIMLFYIDGCAEYVRDGRGEYKNRKPYEYHSCVIECFENWYLSSTFDTYNSEAIKKLEQELSGNPNISPERRENFLRDVTNLMADIRRYGVRYVRGEATKQEYDELKNREAALNIITKSLSRKNEPFYEKTIVELFMQLFDGKEAGKTEWEGNPEGAKPKIQRWTELSIDFIDYEAVRYKLGDGQWKRANYAEVGFSDRRKGSPNKLWDQFRTLAQHCKGGYIEVRTLKNIQKDLDRICKTLKDFFGPTDRPIVYVKKDKRWQAKFDLSWKRDSRN